MHASTSRYYGRQAQLRGITKTDKTGCLYAINPVTVAVYAEKNNLLGKLGWRLPSVQRSRSLFQSSQVALVPDKTTAQEIMEGELDAKNGNTRRANATDRELQNIDE